MRRTRLIELGFSLGLLQLACDGAPTGSPSVVSRAPGSAPTGLVRAAVSAQGALIVPSPQGELPPLGGGGAGVRPVPRDTTPSSNQQRGIAL